MTELVVDETYTVKLDPDPMQDAVVKFLVQIYKDNKVCDNDEELQKSILDVISYCTVQSEYDRILAEL